MTSITLRRTGDRPLAFEGERIATASTGHTSDDTRGFDLGLYGTAGGTYVLAVDYTTRWEAEQDVAWAQHATNLDQLADALRSIDPLQWATGLQRVQRASAEARDPRVERFRLAWGNAVSDLLEQFPERLA